MSKNAVILQFPGGEPIHVPSPGEEPARPKRRWRAWVGGFLALATVVGTAIGALDRPKSKVTPPPTAVDLPGTLSVRTVEEFCVKHPRGLFRAHVHGVFSSGISLTSDSGSLFNSGPIPPQVAIHPEYYSHTRQYERVVVSPWPRHEAEIAASTWVTVSGVLSCSQPVQLEYLSYRDAVP